MKKIFSTFLLLSITLFSYGQWNCLNPLPMGNDLQNVQMVNEDIGFATGQYGTLIKTTNGGVSWVILENSMIGEFRGFSFADALTGYILSSDYATYESYLYKTVDGGLTWESTHFDQCYLLAISFVDSLIGYIGGNDGLIYKTSDGGINWTDKSIVFDGSPITSFYFLDSLTGYATTGYDPQFYYGYLFKTSDGGDTWFYSSSQTLQYPVHFIDENIGFAMGVYSNTLMKTTDGGITWDSCIDDFLYAHSITFFNSNHGILGLRNGDFYKTSDGGETWNLQVNNFPSRYFGDISFISEFLGITVGTDGFIASTTDGGITWNDNSIIDENIYEFQFVSDSTGYACTPRILYKTHDQGTTWQNISSQQYGNMHIIDFPSEDIGYASTDDATYYTSTLLKSINGGVSWQTIFAESELIGDLYFFDELNGFVSAGNSMLRTHDGGITWDSTILTEDPQLYDIVFLNRDTGFVTLTDYGLSWSKIFRTTDGGDNWVEVFNDYAYFLYIDAIDEYKIVVCSSVGFLNYSNDLGNSWITSEGLNEIGVSGFFSQIDFINDSVGYCLGTTDFYYNSAIFETQDGGLSWIVAKKSSSKLYSIAFNESAETGLIVGESGSILRLSNGGTASAKNIFLQCQSIRIYPNPATNQLEFKVPDTIHGNYTYSIFDTHGKCIYAETDNQTGIKHLTISGFKTGTYFLRIISEDSVATGKFLVK